MRSAVPLAPQRYGQHRIDPARAEPFETEEHGWTQADLARATGKRQSTISQLEDPDYGRFTLSTLQRLAEAFDVALVVRFEPFSRFAEWTANMHPDDLAVPSFDEEVADPARRTRPEDVTIDLPQPKRIGA